MRVPNQVTLASVITQEKLNKRQKVRGMIVPSYADATTVWMDKSCYLMGQYLFSTCVIMGYMTLNWIMPSNYAGHTVTIMLKMHLSIPSEKYIY